MIDGQGSSLAYQESNANDLGAIEATLFINCPQWFSW